jgi:putative sigma-54 modulation protein
MEIAVHGRHVTVPASLKAMADEKIGHLGKYLEGMERAEVRFMEERNPRITEPVACEVTVTGHGHVVRAKATAPDFATALDKVVDKIAHQLTRLKKKLVGRSHPHHGHRFERAGAGAPAELDGIGKAARQNGNGRTDGTSPDEVVEEVMEGDLGLRIVRTKQFSIKPMTPEEAILQMELLSHDFFVFSNAETDRPAVVYRRADGDFGLIDAR